MRLQIATLAGLAACLGLLLAACGPATPAEPASSSEAPAWMSLPLTDVRTGHIFKISDYGEKTLILEMMDPACFVCRDQIKQIAAALATTGGGAVAVSVNTNGSLDAVRVAAYADRNDAPWAFANATDEFSAALTAEFGPGVLSAADTPVIVIAPSGHAHLTEPGIKKADALVDLVTAASQ